MKRLLMILPFLLVAGEADAISRHDMSKMTCEDVQSMLHSEGKAILMSPSSKVAGMMKFDKYVPGRTSCGASGQNWALPVHPKMSGGQACVVYRCISVSKGTVRY